MLAFAALFALAGLACGAEHPAVNPLPELPLFAPGPIHEDDVANLMRGWSAASREAVDAMVDAYGLPQEATPSLFVWRRPGPWKRAEAVSQGARHNFPSEHFDVLAQTIEYKVPENKLADVHRFNGSVVIDRTRGELTVRCGSEEMNILAVNLVDEIARGRRYPAEARRFFARQAQLAAAGRSSPYSERFLFEPSREPAQDADRAAAID